MRYNGATFEQVQSWNGYERCTTSTVFVPPNRNSSDGDIFLVQGNYYRDSSLTYNANSFVYKFSKYTLQLELYQTLTGLSGVYGTAFLKVPDSNKPHSNGFLITNSWYDGDYVTVAKVFDWIDML